MTKTAMKMKSKWMLSLLFSILILLSLSGCFLSVDRLSGEPQVETPVPVSQKAVPENEKPLLIDVSSDTVRNVIAGTLRPDSFLWEVEARYISGDISTDFSSRIYLDGDRFRIEQMEYGYISAVLIGDAERLLTLDGEGRLLKETRRNENISYDALMSAASLEAMLPKINDIGEAYLVSYDGKTCVYVELMSGGIKEKYYFLAEYGLPMRVECFFEDELIYLLETKEFEVLENPTDGGQLTVNS